MVFQRTDPGLYCLPLYCCFCFFCFFTVTFQRSFVGPQQPAVRVRGQTDAAAADVTALVLIKDRERDRDAEVSADEGKAGEIPVTGPDVCLRRERWTRVL